MLARGASAADATTSGWTLSHYAALNGRDELLRDVLNGSGKSVKEGLLNARLAATGETPAHLASKTNQLAALYRLIVAGADVGAVDDRGRKPADASIGDGARAMLGGGKERGGRDGGGGGGDDVAAKMAAMSVASSSPKAAAEAAPPPPAAPARRWSSKAEPTVAETTAKMRAVTADDDDDDDDGAREAQREKIRDELRARRGGGGGRRSKPRGNASFLDKYGLDNMNLFAR